MDLLNFLFSALNTPISFSSPVAHITERKQALYSGWVSVYPDLLKEKKFLISSHIPYVQVLRNR